MATGNPERVKAIRVQVSKMTGAIIVTLVEMGTQRRHLSKKVTGRYDVRMDVGTLRELFPGHSIGWRYNGPDDDYPVIPTLAKWTLPNIGFPIWGDAVIFGWANNRVVDVTVTVRQVMAALAQIDAQQTRKSALLSRN